MRPCRISPVSQCTGVEVPQYRGAVLTAGQQQPSVGGQREVRDPAGVRAQIVTQPARGQVPHVDRAITVAAHHQLVRVLMEETGTSDRPGPTRGSRRHRGRSPPARARADVRTRQVHCQIGMERSGGRRI